MAYWYHLIGSFLVGALPRPVAYALGSLLAPPLSRVWTRQHAWAVRNMEWVLGPDRRRSEVERRVREVFRNYARYLIDVLSALGADEAALELSGPLSPGVIRGIGKDDYVHVIMPVRTAS